jgi:cytochrome b involved in lipid metabolism
MPGFSLRQLREHDIPSDCFMSYQGKVYDITSFVAAHDRWMNIRAWCGRDMTYDFETKAGMGRDHIQKSYHLLERFLVGTLQGGVSENLAPISSEEVRPSGMIEWLCFIVPIVLVLIHRIFLRFSGRRRNSWRRYYRKFWIFALVASSVPAVILGLALAAQNMGFSVLTSSVDWVQWHVWGSVVFSVIALVHAVERLFRRLYF